MPIMTYNYSRNNSVTFTDYEMDQFDKDSLRDPSEKELEIRKGEHIYTAKVFRSHDSDEDLPAGVDRDYYEDFYVYADKENPTMLIIEDEYGHDMFRMSRPIDVKELDDSLMDRQIDIDNQRSEDDYY